MTHNSNIDKILAEHGAEPGEFTHSLKQAIQQELLKARLNELVKLKDAHSITIFDEYLENHIADLQAKLKGDE